MSGIRGVLGLLPFWEKLGEKWRKSQESVINRLLTSGFLNVSMK